MSSVKDKKLNDIPIKVETLSESEKGSTTTTVDYDAKRLEELGYKQEFDREISLFAQAGFAFSTMAVLPNWLVGFAGTMAAGGPMSLFWGFVVISPFITCIGLAMAEVFSAFPVNGGVYSWCYLLSSEEWGPLMSWVCGYLFLGGNIAALMTVAYSLGEFTIAAANILRKDEISNTGANVGLFIVFLVAGIGCSYFGIKFSAFMNKFIVYWAAIGTIIIVIAMPVMAPSNPSAKWVFTEFQNITGYQNSGLTFFLGMLQAGWSLIGYENGAQIAEGTKNADVTGPRGIIISIIGAIAQGIILSIATLFSIQDIDELLDSSFPLSTLFIKATNRSLAVFFMVILIVTQFVTLCNVFLAASQMTWSMSRDGALIPNSKFWYALTGKYKVPLRIMLMLFVICIIVIMPTFGSQVYFSAIMSTAVVSINATYGLPFVCRLIWKRHDMPKGRFNLGRYSLPINVIAVAWIAFFSVILCIPSVSPVAPETMNWACLMIGAIVIFSLAFWFLGGRKTYKGPMQTLAEIKE
ncbi:amino acid/polyamine transporter I [Phascolomyces articulosus]|uniref:Amino acid/polyamine transporter I n=1 Tax=Phascolomyces articulosus TaxID=60185 RepID=A0AAD5PJF6_9FUNG|nr:amino acid/polyamine transporter I [Phascolomyces articulosus]